MDPSERHRDALIMGLFAGVAILVALLVTL